MRHLLLFVAAICATKVAIFLVGCTEQPPLSTAQATVAAAGIQCAETVDREIAAHDTCPAAQFAARGHRECQIAFPKGVNLDCKEDRDK